jgi:hypothetical protein
MVINKARSRILLLLKKIVACVFWQETKAKRPFAHASFILPLLFFLCSLLQTRWALSHTFVVFVYKMKVLKHGERI